MIQTEAEILAEAHELGITDEELAADPMPPMDVLIAQMLSAPFPFRTIWFRPWFRPTWNSSTCYSRPGFEVHVQPGCRCGHR